MSIYKKCSLALILFSLFSGISIYFALPVKMASHWNIYGDVDGYLPRSLMVLLLPAFAAFIYFISDQFISMDPLNKNYPKFIDVYEQFIATLVNFFVYLHLLTLSYNLGYHFNMGKMMAPALLLLFYSIGKLMEKAEPNWFIGIRNPWTLSEREVWLRTHKFAAFLFKSIGALSLVILIDPIFGFFALILSILFVSFGLGLFSFFEYRIHTHRKNNILR